MRRTLLISGKQGSGKTSNSEAITQLAINADFIPKTFKFAKIIYELHDVCLPILKKYGIRPPEMKKDGEFLQIVGTDYGRKMVSPYVWAMPTRDEVGKWLALDPKNLAIIDDMRFSQEAEVFVATGFAARLVAPEAVRKPRCSYWRDPNHESETALDEHELKGRFDFVQSTEFVRIDVSSQNIWNEWRASTIGP